MYRGSRIVLTVVAGGLLLFTGFAFLVVGTAMNLAGVGEDCVVFEEDDADLVPKCLDDQLTERSTAEVLKVSRIEQEAAGDWLDEYDVFVQFLDQDLAAHVYVLETGAVPDAGDIVVVAYSEEDPEYLVALESELDRAHVEVPEAAPDPAPVFITAGVLGGLALLAGVGGGIWSSRGTPKPQPQRHPAWGYGQPGSGYPPPGYGQPPGYPPPGYVPPGYVPPGYVPPGYGAQPGYAPPGSPPPGQPQPPGYPPPGHQPPVAPDQPPAGGTPPPPGLVPPN